MRGVNEYAGSPPGLLLSLLFLSPLAGIHDDAYCGCLNPVITFSYYAHFEHMFYIFRIIAHLFSLFIS